MDRIQVKRWGYTYNNYPQGINYKLYLSTPAFNIQRAVWGYEVGAMGTPHIQGYVEFKRTYRLCNVRKIFGGAHWYRCQGDSKANFIYATKSGNYDLIGDFSNEMEGNNSQQKSLSPSSIVKALIDPASNLQIKLCREYSERPNYFDKMAYIVKEAMELNRLFDVYKITKLYPWQKECLRQIKTMDVNRKILWIVDREGNMGKSHFCNFMSICYKYQILDGCISTRDLGFLLKADSSGFCFDISRSSFGQFDYTALEAVRNGYIITGKYAGKVKRFGSKPVVVFSNDFPDELRLSADRWSILEIGKGPLTDVSKVQLYRSDTDYPYERPLPVPNFSENFNFREYIEKLERRKLFEVPDFGGYSYSAVEINVKLNSPFVVAFWNRLIIRLNIPSLAL